MPRVQSKNLFNFTLNGEYDEDVAEAEAEMNKAIFNGEEGMKFMTELTAAMDKDDTESNMEYVTLMRNMMDTIMKPLFDHPILVDAAKNVEETELKVPTKHDGDFDVPVFIYTPNKFHGDGKKRAAYIYSHGGACIGLSANSYKPLLSHYAIECNVVVFNVDYRLAPETKCPNNVTDFYEVIKYVQQNADDLGIDASRIVIGGESGGGYVCLGAMVMLAQKNEGHLVKVAIPAIAMTDDYTFTDPASMTKEEREHNSAMRKNWKLIAADFETQKNDPLLFPGKANDELLEKFPPTIIEESEFDMFITETTRLANRLRRVGRLLELIIVPGGKHGSTMDPRLKNFKVAMDAKRIVFENYVHN